MIIKDISHFDPTGILLKDAGQINGTENRFLYQNKESLALFGLSGLNDFGARFLDKTIGGRFWQIDPLADIAKRFSPYAYGNNNPLRFIDPTGMESEETKDFTYSDGYSNLSARNSSGAVGFSGAYNNPIYDTEGNLLGTDNKGLQGQAIVMKKENFQQGMKHEDAVRNNLGEAGLINKNALATLMFSLKGLLMRPDYDGYLTKAEVDAWWKGKSGQPLFVDQSKIELSDVTTKDFNNKSGSSFYKNFIWNLSNKLVAMINLYI